MESVKKALRQFFGVVVHGQTYLNALYLFLAFPLGLFYFIFLVTGVSLGIGLSIVWIGLLLLLVVFVVMYALIVFERQVAIWLLHEEIPPITHQNLKEMTLWQQFKVTITNPVTWKGLAYLLLKMPLGILSFTVLVTLFSVSVSLLAAPVYYQWVHPQIFLGIPYWLIDTLGEALLVSLIGAVIGLCSLHIWNGLAWISGKFARVMLGNFSTPVTPLQPGEPVAPEAPQMAA